MDSTYIQLLNNRGQVNGKRNVNKIYLLFAVKEVIKILLEVSKLMQNQERERKLHLVNFLHFEKSRYYVNLFL